MCTGLSGAPAEQRLFSAPTAPCGAFNARAARADVRLAHTGAPDISEELARSINEKYNEINAMYETAIGNEKGRLQGLKNILEQCKSMSRPENSANTPTAICALQAYHPNRKNIGK